jgi:hypothetical protein
VTYKVEIDAIALKVKQEFEAKIDIRYDVECDVREGY